LGDRRVNYKNPPEAIIAEIERDTTTKGWVPVPGATFDLATGTTITTPPEGTKLVEDEWDFDPYLLEIDESLRFPPLATLCGVQAYFTWSGFRDYDLILHIQETDDSFDRVLREYWVDFLPNKVYLYDPARREARRKQFRVRAGPWRHTMRHGLSWDGIYIGFQLRISRSPDTYHMKLWQHKFAPHSQPPQWHKLDLKAATLIPEGREAVPSTSPWTTGRCATM